MDKELNATYNREEQLDNIFCFIYYLSKVSSQGKKFFKDYKKYNDKSRGKKNDYF